MSAITPKIRELPLFIAGEWKEAARVEEIRSPWSGEIVARVHQGGEADMEAALAAAEAAFAVTRQLSRSRRAEILSAISAGLAAHRAQFIEVMVADSGKPHKFAAAEVDRAVATFRFAGEEARRSFGEVVPVDAETRGEGYVARLERFPAGVVGAIAPFNFPLNLVAHKIAPALAAGCPVVLKPPPQSPLAALYLAELATRSGAPPGSVSVVPCAPAVAERLATDPRVAVLSFTGSAGVGWHLKQLAFRKKVILELGGNAGAIVHADADLQWAASQCAIAAFAQAGQVCIKVQRLFVEESVFPHFLELLLAATRSLPIGDPSDPETVVGPLIDEAAAERVMAWIAEAVAAGAEVLLGGRRHALVVEPTILSGVPASTKLAREEVFGPVLTVEPYSNFEAALDAVNDSRYGLQAGVFTRDLGRAERAFRALEVGAVIINDAPTFRVDNMPYGGTKDSGFGREGLRYAIEAMTEPRLLVVKTN